MKKIVKTSAAALIAGSALLVALPAQAFWGPFDWFDDDDDWYGGPWGPYGYGPYGYGPYGYPAYGYPGYGYGSPAYGYPGYGYGYPAYGYPGYGYGTAAPPAPSSSAPEKSE
jgi:hypothetical protein